MQECLDRYGGLVWGLARRLSKNTAEAEDAVQDTFVAVWKAAAKFDARQSSEKTFIAMIARRRLIDRLRASERRVVTESLDDETETVAPQTKVSNALELHEEATRIRRLMDELRVDERRVLELVVDQGLSQSEVSQQTGLPLGTVKTHARRGMMRLRELLADGATERGAVR